MDLGQKFEKIVSEASYISVKPMPSPEALKRFYSQSYFQHPRPGMPQPEYSMAELEQKRLRARVLLKAVAAACGQTPTLSDRFLDIGCGEGFVLNAALEAGYHADGIDFSEHGLRTFHPELLPKLRMGDACDLLEQAGEKNESFAVCAMQNVLEHVIDPASVLGSVRKVLAINGLAVITVPNDYSRLQERAAELQFIDREYWFAPPDHLHYFNIGSLTAFVRRNGFQVVDAYADFPIEIYLFHPDSNYVLDPSRGKAAHRARLLLDLLWAESGIDNYLALCRAMTACGIGRNVTMIVRLT